MVASYARGFPQPLIFTHFCVYTMVRMQVTNSTHAIPKSSWAKGWDSYLPLGPARCWEDVLQLEDHTKGWIMDHLCQMDAASQDQGVLFGAAFGNAPPPQKKNQWLGMGESQHLKARHLHSRNIMWFNGPGPAFVMDSNSWHVGVEIEFEIPAFGSHDQVIWHQQGVVIRTFQ